MTSSAGWWMKVKFTWSNSLDDGVMWYRSRKTSPSTDDWYINSKRIIWTPVRWAIVIDCVVFVNEIRTNREIRVVAERKVTYYRPERLHSSDKIFSVSQQWNEALNATLFTNSVLLPWNVMNVNRFGLLYLNLIAIVRVVLAGSTTG